MKDRSVQGETVSVPLSVTHLVGQGSSQRCPERVSPPLPVPWGTGTQVHAPGFALAPGEKVLGEGRVVHGMDPDVVLVEAL